MQLIVIGVGTRVDQNELAAASSGDGSYFWVEDYADLDSKVDDIKHRLCEGMLGVSILRKCYMCQRISL